MTLPCCATTAILYDPLSLGLPTISSLYAECHALSYAKLSLSIDPKVHSALSTELSIEASQKQKLSSLASAHDLVSPILASDTHPPKTKYLHVKKDIKNNLMTPLYITGTKKSSPLLPKVIFSPCST